MCEKISREEDLSLFLSSKHSAGHGTREGRSKRRNPPCCNLLQVASHIHATFCLRRELGCSLFFSFAKSSAMSPSTRRAMTIICFRSCFLLALSVSWMPPTGWGTSALLTSNQLFCVGGGRKPLVDEDDNSSVFRFVVGTGLEDGEDDEDDDDDDGSLDVSLDAFQARKRQEQEQAEIISKRQRDEEFDGYALRDSIFEKWNQCYDVDFNRVDSFGFKCLYLNILSFHLGGRRFRHETEMDYLCHLQAVVEILQKYNQLDNVLVQIAETKKKPRAGTSPLVAVPIRLDLTPEEIKQILGY